MRIKKPQPFDPDREYKPGERSIYHGKIIIAEKWTKLKQDIAESPDSLLMFRCCRCAIKKEDCPVYGLHCDPAHRSDRNKIYFREMNFKYKGYDKPKSDGK